MILRKQQVIRSSSLVSFLKRLRKLKEQFKEEKNIQRQGRFDSENTRKKSVQLDFNATLT